MYSELDYIQDVDCVCDDDKFVTIIYAFTSLKKGQK